MFHKPPTNCSQAPTSVRNSLYPTITMFPIVGLFFPLNLRKHIVLLCINVCVISKERTYSKVCNAERPVRIFGLGAELQLSL